MSVCLYVCQYVCLCVCMSVAKSEAERRLTSAQLALMLQEESIRHNNQQHKEMLDKMSSLQRTLGVVDSDKQQLQVTYFFH